MALQRVCECLNAQKLLHLQLVSKRFYFTFVAFVMRGVSVFRRRGVRLYRNCGWLEVFTQFEWQKLFVKEEGEDSQERLTFFEDKNQNSSTCSKLIQVNHTDVWVIGGGRPMSASLLAREYDVPTSCFKINIKTGLILVK